MTVRRSILWPRMRSVWPLLLSVLLSTLIASSLVAAFAGFAATALPQAVSQELKSAAHKSIVISGAINAAQVRADRPVVSSTIRHAFGGVPYSAAGAVWSDPIGLPAARGTKVVPLIQAAAMNEIRMRAKLTAGSWPAAARSNSRAVIAAAVPANVAAALRLNIGQVLVLRDRQTSAKVRFRVTGLYRPLNVAAPYWGLDLISPTGVSEQPGFITYGPFVVDASAFTSPHLAIGGETWLYGLATTKIAASQLVPLASRVTSALSHLTGSLDLGGLQAVSDLPAVLRGVATKLVVAKSLLLVGELELLLLAGAALTLTARTLASQREEESAIFNSRGAGRRQLLAMAFGEALIVTAIAAAAGALLGSRLAAVLATIGPLRSAGLRITGIPVDDWWTVGAVLLLCMFIMIWPALRSGNPGMIAVRRGRRAAALLAATAGADVAILVLAGLGAWQLREFSVLGKTSAGVGVDPVLAVAPAVALAAGTVLPVRLLPLLAKAGDRLAARTRRLGSALTSWELSRRATRQSAPMLLVVLAVGTSTLALAQHQSWRQSAFDQSAFIVGADVRADTLLPATLASAGRVAHAAGVRSAMAVSTSLSAPTSGQVLAIDSREAPTTVLLQGGEAASGQWWRRIPTPSTHGFITLPGRPRRLRIVASMAPGKGPGIGPVPVTASILDASGIAYTVSLGTLPPDGRDHALVATLTPTGQANYPLEMFGVSVRYTLPPIPNAAHAAAADARIVTFSVADLATAPAQTGAFSGRLNPHALLARWRAGVSSFTLATSGIGKPPHLLHTTTAQALSVRFHPGDGVINGIYSGTYSGPPEPVDGTVTLDAPLRAAEIPAVATTAFLRANRLTIGSLIQVASNQSAINVRVVAAMKSFPTITDPAGGLIVDELAAQEQVIAQGQEPFPVTEWWLATTAGQVPPGLPRGTAIRDRARLAKALLSDPMSAIPQQAIQATAIAAALLAALGFSVSVAGSVRERRSQSALLAALGVDGRGQARLLCLEALVLSVPAAATGLLLGAVLAHLLVPAVTLTASAAAPVVPVLVKVPVLVAAAIALIVTAIPVLAAATSSIYRPDPAAELRMAAT